MDNPARILEVATRLFARQGFDGTSIQAIADEVGITKQTLLYHYPSKDDLRRAVLDNLFEHWRSVLPQLLAAVTSGRQRFDALTGELLRFFRADPDRARLVLREALDRPDHLRGRLAESLRPWVLLVSQYVRQGQTEGRIPDDVEPEAYVMHVIVLVITAVSTFEALGGALSGGTPGSAVEDRYFDELARIARTSLFKSSGRKK